ncbi:FecR domain-containing protein [Asticcacaulis sp. AND118]|uniref:FecR family protein n=1 Tax=Asticcacaulis sp. AND118 TaxID=2840468 RepID=UPI002104EAC2|nr:FecR domain-containing protein [Asticcacaulis sp. AND118]
MSETDDRTLEAWLAQDPRHAGAFARARAVSLYSERARALGETYNPEQFVEVAPVSHTAPPPTRRQFLWRGGSIAAGFSAAVVGTALWTSRGEAYETQRGQMTVVPLADGSIVSLNTASRIRVVYTSTRRTVHLEAGEVFFEVVPDRERPFVVEAGPARLSAARSRFAVRHLNEAPIEVLVSSGAVEVEGGTLQRTPVRLGANMRALAAVANGQLKLASATRVAPIEIERNMAWREGRIAFEGDTLREAAAEFLRYSDTRIVIDDPAIANEPITGLFQVNDPVGFARAVADSFNLKADVGEKQVRLHR